MSSDKAMKSATLELTQRIQMHFPRNIPPNILKEWNSCRVDILQQKLFEVFSQGLAEKIEKFSLMLELKITIPDDCQRVGYLGEFYKDYSDVIKIYNDCLVREDLCTLISGKTYLVKIWYINQGMSATIKEILSLLAANNACLDYALYGGLILWRQKRHELPSNKTWISVYKVHEEKNSSTLTDIQLKCDNAIIFKPWMDIRYKFGSNYCVIGFCDCEEPEA